MASSSACYLSSSSKAMALRLHSPFLQTLKGPSCYVEAHNSCFGPKLSDSFRNGRMKVSCAMNMAAGQSGEPEKLNFDTIVDKAKKLWDSSPQPVKSFPWNRALENFIQLILDLVVAVINYLSVPLLAVSSLSEMSYCAHQKKLFFVPFPFLVGIAVAGVLKETALEMSPLLKEAEVPWHLIVIAIFFTLIKLPGPYYPYWGRIFIPHFANGVLWRTIWSAFLWYGRPRKASGEMPIQNSLNGSQSEANQN